MSAQTRISNASLVAHIHAVAKNPEGYQAFDLRGFLTQLQDSIVLSSEAGKPATSYPDQQMAVRALEVVVAELLITKTRSIEQIVSAATDRDCYRDEYPVAGNISSLRYDLARALQADDVAGSLGFQNVVDRMAILLGYRG